jgi:hypothetical protein
MENLMKNGQGFISKVSPTNGTIVELNWVTGLNAPKGMAVSDDSSKLYVSDITDLVEIDIVSGQITNRYTVPESTFLMMSHPISKEISMFLILVLMPFTSLTRIINHHCKYGYKHLN